MPKKALEFDPRRLTLRQEDDLNELMQGRSGQLRPNEKLCGLLAAASNWTSDELYDLTIGDFQKALTSFMTKKQSEQDAAINPTIESA